jgi:hypothetical protein
MLEKKMEKISLLVLFGYFAVFPAYADDAGVNAAPPQLHIKHKKAVDPAEVEEHIQYDNTVNTKYGVVQYNTHGSIIAVNRKLVYHNSNVGLMKNIGDFKLDNEEVLLFEGAFLGSGMANLVGETFFLVLKPNLPPTIVQTMIDPENNPVKKAWKQNNVIYVDFKVGTYDEIISPLKFESEKVVISKMSPDLYAKKASTLTGDDCQRLYDMEIDNCSGWDVSENEQCLADSYNNMENFLPGNPKFYEKELKSSCMNLCKGKDVLYEDFKLTVCNIK